MRTCRHRVFTEKGNICETYLIKRRGDIGYVLCFQPNPKVNVELTALYRFRCFPFLLQKHSARHSRLPKRDGRTCREFRGEKERMDSDRDWTGNRSKVRIGSIGKRPAVRRTTTGLMGGSGRSSTCTGYFKLSTTKDATG